jgi:hypothetical protein
MPATPVLVMLMTGEPAVAGGITGDVTIVSSLPAQPASIQSENSQRFVA